MNRLLLKHKPKDLTDEKFTKMWDNSGYLLSVLAEVIRELLPTEKIQEGDFGDPNHYAKMVWAQAQRDFAQKILDLMPKSIDNPK